MKGRVAIKVAVDLIFRSAFFKKHYDSRTAVLAPGSVTVHSRLINDYIIMILIDTSLCNLYGCLITAES